MEKVFTYFFGLVTVFFLTGCFQRPTSQIEVNFLLPETRTVRSSDMQALSVCSLENSYICAANGDATESCQSVSATTDPAAFAGLGSGDSVLTFGSPTSMTLTAGTGWKFYYLGVFGSTGCTSGNSILSYAGVSDQTLSADTDIALDVLTPSTALSTSPATAPTGFANVTLQWTSAGSNSCTSSGNVTLTVGKNKTPVTLSTGISYSSSFTAGSGSLTLGPLPKNLTYAARLTQTSPSAGTLDLSFSTTSADSVTVTVTSELCPSDGAGSAILTISDGATYDFGSAEVGGSFAVHSFTVTNTSSTDTASSMTGTVSGAPFTFVGGSYPGTSGDCGSSLAPNATCNMVVKFTAATVGVTTGSLSLSYSNVSSFSVTRPLTATGTALTAPTAPTGLTAFAAPMTGILLNWTDNSSNESGFEVERSTTSGAGFVLLTTTAAGVNSYTDSSTSTGTTYYYRVRAVNAAGNSAYLAEASEMGP